MPYDNNAFTIDTDAQHLERARTIEDGIVTYGPTLGFDPAQILTIGGHRALFEDALSDADKEYADVDEVYAELAEMETAARKQYIKCHNYVLGEMVFAETGTIEWLEEAFDTVYEMPDRRSDFIRVAGFALDRYDNILIEHPDVTLNATLFGDLQTMIDDLIAKEKSVKKERGEAREATAIKNSIRTNGEKLYRWVYRRAISFWGDDDSRLLELGMVPKSLIGTPSEPEEPQAEWPAAVLNFMSVLILIPIKLINLSWDMLIGAVSYNLYRAKGPIGNPPTKKPDTPWKTGLTEGLLGDMDIAPGYVFVYWVCGVDEFGVEGEFCDPIMMEYPV